jgi:uncharacterized protein DUF4124
MVTRFLRIALPLALVAAFGLQTARADIYTWVDASGSINVSNLSPPEGVRVTSVIRATAPAVTGDESAIDAAQQAKAKALEDRVRQLENEVELSKREPPPIPYPPIPYPPMPPIVQYFVEAPPVFNQYAVSDAPPANYGCDPTFNCGLAWTPGFYPVSVVVLRAPGFRHFRPSPDGHVGHSPPRTSPHTSLISPLPTSLVTPLTGPLVQPLPPVVQPLVPPLSFHSGSRKG